MKIELGLVIKGASIPLDKVLDNNTLGFDEGEWGSIEWEEDDSNPAWNIPGDTTILGYMQEGEY